MKSSHMLDDKKGRAATHKKLMDQGMKNPGVAEIMELYQASHQIEMSVRAATEVMELRVVTSSSSTWGSDADMGWDS